VRAGNRVETVFPREARPDGHLPVGHFSVFDMTACLDALEPADIAHRRGSLGDRGTDGILDVMTMSLVRGQRIDS
jgi:hypothetical protein